MKHFHTIYIGINYKTPDKTINWVNSIRKHCPNSLVVVADNSEEYNPQLKDLIKDFSVYVDTKENLGYFNGAAFALDLIKRDYSFDWLVVSNVDVELESDNVDDYLDLYPSAGVIAPSIISILDEYDKNPYRIIRPTKKSLIIKKIAFSNAVFCHIYTLLSSIRNNRNRKKNINKMRANEGQSIYLPYGAVFYFSRLYFENGCKLKFPLFLFGEELYVAEQTRKVDLNIVYVPSIVFKNYEHASTSKLTSKNVRLNNYLAIKYILKNYY